MCTSCGLCDILGRRDFSLLNLFKATTLLGHEYFTLHFLMLLHYCKALVQEIFSGPQIAQKSRESLALQQSA